MNHTMNDFLVKNAPGKGQGLFSTKSFDKNQVLFKFEGVKILRENINDFSGQAAANLLQIGTNLYLDLTGYSSYFINHSCTPNCFIRVVANTAFLLSLLPIKEGDELTFDYSSTSTEDHTTWSMKCNCSIFGCRKTISGFNALAEKHKQSYDMNIVPNYVKVK